MDPMRKMKLGARLRTLRQRRELTQDVLAERVGLHTTYIAKLEAGKAVPSLDALTRLADALEVPVASIVSAIDNSPSSHDPDLSDITNMLQVCDVVERTYLRDAIKLFVNFTRSSPRT